MEPKRQEKSQDRATTTKPRRIGRRCFFLALKKKAKRPSKKQNAMGIINER
jgi:hypothetical protein